MNTNHGLILKSPSPEEWRLGSGLASQKFGAEDINPEGDWTPYKMPDERQSNGRFDSMACAVFATLKAWAMLAKCHGFDFPSDMSERYSAVMCGTTPQGTDPHDVGEITRKSAGVIPQAAMPWTDEIDTFEEFFDRRMAHSMHPFGRKLLDRFELGHEWIFQWGNSLSPKEKEILLRSALKRGTVCVSADGSWQKKGKFYNKNVGDTDGHWVTALGFNGKRLVIHDQYPPFVKELAPGYDHTVAKLYFLKRKDEKVRSFWSGIWDAFAKLARI